jgi:preprotein translocase subunit SecD
MRNKSIGTTVLIFAILLVFVYGIFGIPKGIGLNAWKTALTDRIHLGLDLKGGTHLVLQVMVNEAVSAVTDNDVARVQADLQQGGFPARSVLKPDPKKPEVIQIQGTPPDRTGDVRSLLDSRYGNQYTISSGANNIWTLTMKQTEVQATEQHTLQQAIDTIRTRIDSLGVTEPTIQEYNLGTNQILVELPGLDDLSRVHDIIQSTARLEIHLVVGGPFATEQAAAQSVGGTIPPDNIVMA